MRKPRYYYESNFYHVMVQGDERKIIFQSSRNKQKYLYYLRHNAFRNDVEIIAYCNHVHILVFCPEIERVSKMMSQCNTSFGLYYSKKRQKVGHVFRDRFRSEAIYTKNHLINCIKYIHNNPVKAKLCKNPNDYYFSSYSGFEKIDNRLKEIMDITENDIYEIMKSSNTITKFLEDEYSKDDVLGAFSEIKSKHEHINDINLKTVAIYNEMKECCRVCDIEIAKLLDISRITLYKRLKKCGYK